MVRKHQCRKKISCIIELIFFIQILPFTLFSQGGSADIISHYEKDIKKNAQVLDSIKIELERGRKRIKELASQEGKYLDQLKQLEDNINSSQKYLSLVTSQIDTLKDRIITLQDSLIIYDSELNIRQNKMKKRLRSIYMSGNPGITEILLTSQNMGDVLAKVRYFQELSNYDRKLLNAIDSTKQIVFVRKNELELQQTNLTELKSKKENEQIILRKEKNSRKSMVNEIQNEKSAYETMVKELAQAQKELNFLLTQLEKKRKKAKTEYERGLKVAFEKRIGKLPWPAEGQISKKYGKIVHPVYKTVTVNNGIDIRAKKGDGVFCVAPGQVDYIGTMRGYGKFVIVNHFGGYITIYAHLNTINVDIGKEVKYGTILGTVGESGSLDGVKLHFQIRKSTDTLNPSKWLEKRES